MNKKHIFIVLIGMLFTSLIVGTWVIAAPKAISMMNPSIKTVIRQHNDSIDVYNMDVDVTPVVMTEEDHMQYVCDMPVATSNEYVVRTAEFSDGSVAEMNWDYVQSRHVVLEWQYNSPIPEGFSRAVRIFKEYTRMAIDVVNAGHIAGPIDYVIPVGVFEHPRNNETAIAWIDNLDYNWIDGLVTITQAKFGFNPIMLSYDNDSMAHAVLHELGHVYGLAHTHELPGLQVDSIMSYEDDAYEGHYLAGDIAGLQHLLCK